MKGFETPSQEQQEEEPLSERHRGWALSKIKELSEEHPKLVRRIAEAMIAAPTAIGTIGGAAAAYEVTGRPDAAVGGVFPGAVIGGMMSLRVAEWIRNVAAEAGIDVEKLYEEPGELKEALQP